VIVELALRQQLAIYSQKQRRPRLSPLDRAFWAALSHLWPRWKTALVVVQPETVIRWHRRRFRRYWWSISSPGPGRPAILQEIRDLIARMATENGWRARRIQGELAMLGFRVSLATISRHLPKTRPDPRARQSWRTFLRNHRDLICAMDFFVVPTARFRLLYAWFLVDHGRRRVLHLNVTAHPSACWVVQQLREAFPESPRHRHLILDNDAIFSDEVSRSIAAFVPSGPPFGVHGRTGRPSGSSAPCEESCSIMSSYSTSTTCGVCFETTSSTTTPSASTRRSAMLPKVESPRRGPAGLPGSPRSAESVDFIIDTPGVRQRERRMNNENRQPRLRQLVPKGCNSDSSSR